MAGQVNDVLTRHTGEPKDSKNFGMLVDYITTMLTNGRTMPQMASDLKDMLGEDEAREFVKELEATVKATSSDGAQEAGVMAGTFVTPSISTGSRTVVQVPVPEKQQQQRQESNEGTRYAQKGGSGGGGGLNVSLDTVRYRGDDRRNYGRRSRNRSRNRSRDPDRGHGSSSYRQERGRGHGSSSYRQERGRDRERDMGLDRGRGRDRDRDSDRYRDGDRYRDREWGREREWNTPGSYSRDIRSHDIEKEDGRGRDRDRDRDRERGRDRESGRDSRSRRCNLDQTQYYFISSLTLSQPHDVFLTSILSIHLSILQS